MKIFKSLLIATVAIALTACSTTYKTEKTEHEKIISLAMDQKSFYVLGTEHDYQFARKDTQPIENLVKSPYAKKISYIEASGEVYNQKEVTAKLTLIISPINFTDRQQQDLIQNYGFRLVKDISPDSLYWKNPALLSHLKKSPNLLRHDYNFINGKIVEIKNRESFVQQYALSKPIQLKVDYVKRGSQVNGTDATGVLIAPVVIVAAIPIFLVWGLSCEIGGC